MKDVKINILSCCIQYYPNNIAHPLWSYYNMHLLFCISTYHRPHIHIDRFFVSSADPGALQLEEAWFLGKINNRLWHWFVLFAKHMWPSCFNINMTCPNAKEKTRWWQHCSRTMFNLVKTGWGPACWSAWPKSIPKNAVDDTSCHHLRMWKQSSAKYWGNRCWQKKNVCNSRKMSPTPQFTIWNIPIVLEMRNLVFTSTYFCIWFPTSFGDVYQHAEALAVKTLAQEWALLRVWDALEFMDENEDVTSTTLEATGDISEADSKAMLILWWH